MRTRSVSRHKAPTPPRVAALQAVVRLWCQAYSRASIPKSLLVTAEHTPVATLFNTRLLDPAGGGLIVGLVSLEAVRWVRRGGIKTVREGLQARPNRRDRSYTGKHRRGSKA